MDKCEECGEDGDWCNDPYINRSTAEKIYIEYSLKQSLTKLAQRKLAQRGGFGWAEVAAIHKEYIKKKGHPNGV